MKRLRITKERVIVAIVLIAVVAAVRVVSLQSATPTVLADAGTYIEYDDNSKVLFHSAGSDVFCCTKDGVRLLNANGEAKWEEIVNLQAPVMYATDDVIALGCSNTRRVYVFGITGKMFERRFDASLLSFAVNGKGMLTVILRSGDGFRVEIHKPEQSGAVWRYFVNTENIYPVSADVSEDGRVVALSLLDLTPNAYAAMTTHISFMYIQKNDALLTSDADGKFAGHVLEGDMATVRFVGERLIATTDTGVHCYTLNAFGNFETVVESSWHANYGNKISQLAIGHDTIAVVLGEPNTSISAQESETEPVDLLKIYNMKGQLTGTYQTAGVDHLSIGAKGVVVGSGRLFVCVDKKGNRAWSYGARQDISVVALSDIKTALAVGATESWLLGNKESDH
ncbi:MAG: DUF5711 family protein [Clostridiales bacterium]|jgi:hypothetical protein|nr:DUF5711 family protein [Clostridiales bacterium]